MSTPPVLYTTYTTNHDATVDTHVRGLLSAAAPLVYNNVTGQFSIPKADATTDGYLASADWNHFNNDFIPVLDGYANSDLSGGVLRVADFTLGKLFRPTTGIKAIDWDVEVLIDPSAVTSLDWNARQGLDSLGIQSMDWNDRSLDDGLAHVCVDWQNRNLTASDGSTVLDWESTVTNNTFFGGASAGAATRPTFRALVAADIPSGLPYVPTSRLISTTSPLSGGGDLSADRTLVISQANTSTDGYISSTDWNTFNNKQDALTLPLSIANGGTNNAGPFTAGSIIFSNGTLLTQDNSKLFWDDTNFALCVGTVTQAGALTVTAQTAGQAGCNITGANRGAVTGTGGGFTFLGGSGGSPVSGGGSSGGGFTLTSGPGGNGTSGGASGVISLTGGTGGNSTGVHGLGGAGGGISFQGGTGGVNNSSGTCGGGGSFGLSGGPGGVSATAAVSGIGGACLISSGVGGNSSSTGNAGNGGLISLTAMAGGSVSGAAIAGAGGSIVITAGAAGNPGGSGTGNNGGSVTIIPGAASGAGTAGAIVFGNAAGQVVNFVAGSGAAAPSTSVGVAIVNFYGSSATNFLGTPNAWLSIQANGSNFKIPLYT